MKIFAPITKVDVAKREVYGVMAEEAVDKSGEIFDYESSKPLVKAWSEQFDKATDGKSYGNVRLMHQSVAAGKLIGIEFDDAKKCIPIVAKIVDDSAWKMVEEGVFTGFSIGGRYEKRWSEGQFTRYTARPAEVSLVDNPCMYGAMFTAVKQDGSQEMRKFTGGPVKETLVVDGLKYQLMKAAKTKRVGGKDLSTSDFAYVGDPDKTATWKLPIHDAAHVRNALARFNQTQGIPAGEKSKVLARIKAKAKEFGVEVSEDAAKLAKGLYSIGSLADCISCLDYVAESLEWEADMEGDNSPIPGKLDAIINQLCEILVALAEEETSELTASKSEHKENQQMTPEEKAKMDGLEKDNADLKAQLAKAAPPAAAAAAVPGSEDVKALTAQVAELKKAQEETDKVLGQTLDILEKFAKTPEVPKIVANAAAPGSKASDTAGNGALSEDELKKLSPIDQIKQIHRGGGAPEIPFRPIA